MRRVRFESLCLP